MDEPLMVYIVKGVKIAKSRKKKCTFIIRQPCQDIKTNKQTKLILKEHGVYLVMEVPLPPPK